MFKLRTLRMVGIRVATYMVYSQQRNYMYSIDYTTVHSTRLCSINTREHHTHDIYTNLQTNFSCLNMWTADSQFSMLHVQKSNYDTKYKGTR